MPHAECLNFADEVPDDGECRGEDEDDGGDQRDRIFPREEGSDHDGQR